MKVAAALDNAVNPALSRAFPRVDAEPLIFSLSCFRHGTCILWSRWPKAAGAR